MNSVSHIRAEYDHARTLRAEMEQRQASRERFRLRNIVAMTVPFITELAERHAQGERFFVYPGAIVYDPTGLRLDPQAAQVAPQNAHDRACLAPEQRDNHLPGEARQSVFACGAMLYEMITGKSVGPGMRRPSELVKGLPPAFETLLGKALVSDLGHRPTDLAALAQALHGCSPMASIPPPPADESHLDADRDFEVDVSLSLLPPPLPGAIQITGGPASNPTLSSPGGAPASFPGGPPSSGRVPISGPVSSTEQLAELKAALEADPRPRYVVIKEGMDHGPFTAVELLQQIAGNSFTEHNTLRDTLSHDEMAIGMWEEFAPFAEHAGRNRSVKQERRALEATVVAERKQTQNKALIGGAALVIAAAAFAGWWYRERSKEDIRIGVTADEVQSIDVETGLQKKGSSPGGVMGGTGKGDTDSSGRFIPSVSGGGSCESVAARYVEEYKMGNGADVPPDLSAGAYGAVLNRGTYLNSCGVPSNMAVSVCVAVQNGVALGVSVRTDPSNPGIASCISGAVRGLGYPSHPRLDVTRTHFKAE
jgi:hypothetical protein